MPVAKPRRPLGSAPATTPSSFAFGYINIVGSEWMTVSASRGHYLHGRRTARSDVGKTDYVTWMAPKRAPATM